MGKFIDLTGQRFGKLVANKRVGTNNYGSAIWECRCDCGNTSEVNGRNLRDGITQSCGCLNRELSSHRMYNLHFDNTMPCLLKAKKSKVNTSGVKGVYFDKETNKWRASICLKKKVYNLGRYDKLEDAAMVRKLAEEKLFHPIIEEYEKENANV